MPALLAAEGCAMTQSPQIHSGDTLPLLMFKGQIYRVINVVISIDIRCIDVYIYIHINLCMCIYIYIYMCDSLAMISLLFHDNEQRQSVHHCWNALISVALHTPLATNVYQNLRFETKTSGGDHPLEFAYATGMKATTPLGSTSPGLPAQLVDLYTAVAARPTDSKLMEEITQEHQRI